MNCNKCGFYSYEDEYICLNCESMQDREFPIDQYEKTLFIHEKIIELNKIKKRLAILRFGRQLSILLFFIQLVWAFWMHGFVEIRIPKPNYDIASYSIVFAMALYGIILGKPELLSKKEYTKLRQPKGLIPELKESKITYIVVLLFILLINYFIYFKFLKDLFINDIIARQNMKLETFGAEKLANIFTVRFCIQNLGIGIYYAIHPIFEITNADYFILDRMDEFKKEKSEGTINKI